jgi:hypothetical protein
VGSLLDSVYRHVASITEPRSQTVVLLVGLGTLVIALLVLMRTRWGQAKPISKCIALSVFAHLLLIFYAYFIRTVVKVPIPGPDEVVSVTLVPPVEEEPTEETPEQSLPEDPVRQPEPWNDFATEPPADPLTPATAPERTLADAAPTPERQREVSPVPVDQTALPEVPSTQETDLPDAADVAMMAPRVTQPAAQAQPSIEMPAVAAEPATTPQGPAATEAPRLTRITDDQLPDRQTPEQLPEELLAGSIEIQRLTDLPTAVSEADALAAEADDPRQSENQVGGHAASPPPAESSPLMPIPMASLPSTGREPPMQAAGLQRVADGDALPETYRARTSDNRSTIVIRNGGNADTEAAVQAALAWLAANQEADGRWNPRLHSAGRETRVYGHDRGGAGTKADTGISALAILAFLGTGQSHLEGEHRETIQRGLEFLLRSQAADGNLAGGARLFARMYCHGMAALAISEAYAMTGDHRLRPYVERAIGFTVRAQSPRDGGWRYQPGDTGDMSQFGWQLMAVKSAELAGVNVSSTTRQGMLRFLQSVSSGRHGGLASYRPHSRVSATMTAEALFCRLFIDARQSESATREAVDMLMQQTPESGQVNLYYWYYATIALFQLGGPNWETWNDHLQQRLLAVQQRTGPDAGSWSPKTVWGSYGGRVYSTSMAALCLEVYYRYLPIFEDSRR